MSTFTYTGTITDSYGITHTNPIFVIENFAQQVHSSVYGSYNYETGEFASEESDTRHVNYTVMFWTNQSAKDDGANALMFSRSSQRANNNYNFMTDSTLPTAASILVACEEHFLQNVLPEFTHS